MGHPENKDNTLANINLLIAGYNLHEKASLPLVDLLLGKWEDGSGWENNVDPGFSGDFAGLSGTVSAPNGWTSPFYYSVKSATKIDLWYSNDSLQGDWITPSTGNALSNIAFWRAPETSEIPEPATFALLGIGLIGIAGIGRRKTK